MSYVAPLPEQPVRDHRDDHDDDGGDDDDDGDGDDDKFTWCYIQSGHP